MKRDFRRTFSADVEGAADAWFTDGLNQRSVPKQALFYRETREHDNMFARDATANPAFDGAAYASKAKLRGDQNHIKKPVKKWRCGKPPRWHSPFERDHGRNLQKERLRKMNHKEGYEGSLGVCDPRDDEGVSRRERRAQESERTERRRPASTHEKEAAGTQCGLYS